ncbi:MAG TPA: chitobiase/beta-hexosaminidase C-terminal domain-containing protein, partial [Atopostipes sp.]|nr:chitobiase/beta-hexosaminidase C-terminal domain-containing protein [Atopostipes sp.]
FSTIRETFTALYFPTKNGIELSEFKLEFKENKFDGERQVIDCLDENKKYVYFSTDNEFLEILQNKCEVRLFTQKEQRYSQIKERAATTVIWQWYDPAQLDTLKADCLKKDKWREIGGYLVKGPFEKEPTSVVVEQTYYDDTKHEFTLKIQGIGGRVFYDIGADPTSASEEITDQIFITKEPTMRFVCIDPEGERKTGDVFEFIGKVPVKHEQRTTVNGEVMELATNPTFEIRYTTDGSEPKENGGIYNEEFVLPQDCKFVRVAVYFQDKVLEEKDIRITESGSRSGGIEIDTTRPLLYRYKHKREMSDTESSYDEFSLLSRLEGILIKGATAAIYNKANTEYYVDFNASAPYWAGDLQALIDLVRETSFQDMEVIVIFGYKELTFLKGELFSEWMKINKHDLEHLLKIGDIEQ